MRFLTFLVVLGLLSNSQITNFAHGFSFPPPPRRIVSLAPLVQPAGYLGFGTMFGILALATILPTLYRPRNITSAPECPATYYLYSTECGRLCYRYESTNCKSWTAARASCREEGGDLLEPTVCYYQFFKDLAKQNEGSCSNFWLGISSTTPGSDYVSVRGNIVPETFPYWNPGEPNAIAAGGNCVQMLRVANYLMDDTGCSTSKGFICQIIV